MWSLGRYEIIEQLGQGSMGTVYKARDPILGRDVAIKRILVQPGEHSEAVEFRERFFREARAAGKLSHPGIVTVFDVSEHEGTPFLVMEYVAGRTLLSILQNDERMSLDRACDVGVQLAEALDYAHRNGVIHRDIKPANILVTSDGRIKIADFGVARLIESQLTARGQLLGTPAFMAPEQFIGMPVDARSDLFSAGVVIYCMMTGEKPFAGDTLVGVQYRVMHTEAVEPRKLNPGISPRLEALVLRTIDKDPSKRYASGAELARDLRLCLEGGREPASSMTTAGTPPYEPTLLMTAKPVGAYARRRLKIGLFVLIPFLMTFFAATTFYFARHRSPKDAVSTAEAAKTPRALEAAPPELVAEHSGPDVRTQAQTESVSREEPAKETSKALSIENPRVKAQRVGLTANPAPVVPPAPQPGPPIASVVVSPPEPEPPRRPVDEATAKEINDAVSAPAVSETAASYKSSRLLIASVAVPESFTIIVNVDNELFFSRNATVAANFPVDDRTGRIQLQSLQSIPSAPLSEERPLPPGKHKVQVNVMMASRRVGKVQEITERFHSGQRRILEIDFLSEAQSSHGRDPSLFKITLK
jgi:serine/threonine-protein kinase